MATAPSAQVAPISSTDNAKSAYQVGVTSDLEHHAALLTSMS